MNPTCFHSSPTIARPPFPLLIITGAQHKCSFHTNSPIYPPFPSISLNCASSVYCVWLLLTWDFQLAPYSLLICSHPIKFPRVGEIWRVLGHPFSAEYSLLNLNILTPQIRSFIFLLLCLHYFKSWGIPINSLWIVSENLVWEKTASCPFIV